MARGMWTNLPRWYACVQARPVDCLFHAFPCEDASEGMIAFLLFHAVFAHVAHGSPRTSSLCVCVCVCVCVCYLAY
jgi:hypothetical protein